MGKIGKRHKKITSRTVENQQPPMVFRCLDEGQDYGYVQKNLGNCRFGILCNDGKERMGILRGVMRKRVWVVAGDIVLYSTRGFEDGKVDVLHKYKSDEVPKIASEISQTIYTMYHGSASMGDSCSDAYVAFMEEDDGGGLVPSRTGRRMGGDEDDSSDEDGLDVDAI